MLFRFFQHLYERRGMSRFGLFGLLVLGFFLLEFIISSVFLLLGEVVLFAMGKEEPVQITTFCANILPSVASVSGVVSLIVGCVMYSVIAWVITAEQAAKRYQENATQRWGKLVITPKSGLQWRSICAFVDEEVAGSFFYSCPSSIPLEMHIEPGHHEVRVGFGCWQSTRIHLDIKPYEEVHLRLHQRYWRGYWINFLILSGVLLLMVHDMTHISYSWIPGVLQMVHTMFGFSSPTVDKFLTALLLRALFIRWLLYGLVALLLVKIQKPTLILERNTGTQTGCVSN